MTVAAVFLTYNEAHVLPRLLESIEPHVDRAVVIDGASSDGSADLVRDAFGKSRLWLDVVDAPYMDKRRQLMRKAAGRGDYLLLVDPDHELVTHGELGPLTDDAYTLTERQGTWRFRMPRLVKGDRVWTYAGGPVHEYLEAPTDTPLDAWELIHHADSRPDADKKAANLAGLLCQLAANPDDARSQFYLGNAYLDQGRWAEAVEAYDRRLRMGGYDQELFCAMLYKGKCQLRMGLVGEARWTFGWCAQRWPGRAEPLEWLRLTLPLADGLFVESDCYGERS